MNESCKKYYFGLLKRMGYVIGSSLLIAYGVYTYRKHNKENLEKIVDSSVVDSLDIFSNYSVE